MAEQSHREEMSAAIKAQRERQAAPRLTAPPANASPPAQEPASETEAGSGKRFLDRLRGK
jgi:hypothetical protein